MSNINGPNVCDNNESKECNVNELDVCSINEPIKCNITELTVIGVMLLHLMC